jgi:hypothetical protein
MKLLRDANKTVAWKSSSKIRKRWVLVGVVGADRAMKGGPKMLYTIAVVLIVLWLLGLVTSTVLGGFIHILLVVAIIAILIRIINGRPPV